MDHTAFVAGAGIATKTFTETRACVAQIRSPGFTAPARTIVLRRSAFVQSAGNDAFAPSCGSCGGHHPFGRHCAGKAKTAAAVQMALTLTAGEQAIADLMTENAAFVRGEAKVFPGVPEERVRLSTEGQTPRVAIIACADSRVAPEIMFRSNVGELFVIRAAGNTAWGNEVLGSLEFAINVLKVSAVMVIGHSKCGAVAAAVGGGELPGALGAHITNIAKGLGAKGGIISDVEKAVEVNVKVALDFLRKDPNGAVAQGEKNGLAVRGAVYDITTGAVTLVD